ncbi:helix-turn-helix transcriptional regulator [Herbiconiux sp. VKM Ac-2851]|uniref:helix-turn-helix domain-containing protein n=1 Tax=Herbiconiux sp. VKM Ac-2851 TaxID=2739025 RepID=UPI001565FAC6|nr:helix-turn-helix transcriptional regulator [Herbiconiux sp. VKM Ac-2851]NQX36290.1 helix-turn-helix transcriptional regulator [Herbiconiux sp. VKM Ac-2851]
MANIAKLPQTDTPAGYVAGEVRAQLARRGWSATRLAVSIGETQSWMSRRLTGDVPFDVDTLTKIAEALGVHPGSFFPDGGDTSPSGGLQLTAGEQRMIVAMRMAAEMEDRSKD